MNESIDRAFSTAVEPLRGALRLHCYRMLGSSHDSDDVVQEALLRAWRARASLDDPTRMRPWLYRIATNVCIDELARRPRRALASDLGGPSDPKAPYRDPLEVAEWLEPMPDAWLAAADEDAGARYTLRESVALAFIAALQVLSPAQRATLLLRDVVGLSADEAAAALEQTVSATNSTLHRARVAIEEKVAHRDPASFAKAPSPEDEAALARYVRAIAESDVEAMIALLHDDMHTTMPPSPTWIEGRSANEAFYRRMFSAWRPGAARVVPVGVNGGPGFAFYRDGVLRAVEAVEVSAGKIRRMHHFMQPAMVTLFAIE